jgi:DNA-binding GntR family transcriptional regulator
MKPKTKKIMQPQEDSSQIAYHGIRRMLYSKELTPGQKIAYRDLAEKLQLSPTPIIQALKWLELQGFVYHEPKRGYSMAPFSLKEIEEGTQDGTRGASFGRKGVLFERKAF